MKAKAETNNLIAEVARVDPRPWAEIVMDLVHTSDRMYTEYRTKLDDGTLTAEDQERLWSTMDRTMKFIHAGVQTGMMAKITESHQRNVELEGEIISRVVTDVVTKLIDGLGFNPAHRTQVMDWAIQAASARLAAGPDGSADVIPDPPVPRLAITTGTTNPTGDDHEPKDDSGPETDANEPVDAELVDDEPQAPARTRTRPARSPMTTQITPWRN